MPTPTMVAAAIDRFGPPSVLKRHLLPLPQPGPHEVLIALHAAGVGVWDAEFRDGSWRPYGRADFPLVPGTDGAGIVVASGARVRRLRVGDRAWAVDYANPKGGFYAEYVAVDAGHAARVPRRLDLLHAGAAVATALTALQGIDDALHVRRGETVLILGASGAVGTLAVQLARRRGAHVLATASGPRATRLVRRLGAEAVIDARRTDARDRLQALTPDGLDAALVLTGGRVTEQCLALVRSGGRVAYPFGVEPKPRRRPKVRLLVFNAVAGPREFARLARAVSATRLKVPIAAAYPLARAAQAHARLERGRLLGRIVLRVRR